MVEILLEWLKDVGIVGTFIVMFLEGSSLPFPGVVVVLAYGYLLPINYFNTLWIAAGMSVFYTVASLIPYFLGLKLNGMIGQRSPKGLEKAKKVFLEVGSWSVALSRPFGIGNYISYAAGMSRMRLIPYLLLTFAGIYPWSYFMLLLGNYFNGSYTAFQKFYADNIPIILLIISLLFFIMVSIKWARKGGLNRV